MPSSVVVGIHASKTLRADEHRSGCPERPPIRLSRATREPVGLMEAPGRPTRVEAVCWIVFTAPPNPPQFPSVASQNRSSSDDPREAVVTIPRTRRQATETSLPSSCRISGSRCQRLPQRVVTTNRTQQRDTTNVNTAQTLSDKDPANPPPTKKIAARSSAWWRCYRLQLKTRSDLRI
jgi:hypothetical protein